MDKHEGFEVCGACNGHKWLVWKGREGYVSESHPASPFVEPCQFCNGGEKPEQPPLVRPREFKVGVCDG